MANYNKQIKAKASQVLSAWGTLSKDDTFAGMTLAQFTQLVSAVDTQSNNMAGMVAQYYGGLKQRDDLHQTLNDSAMAVVNAVKADLAKHGPDSPLYKAMGYVPKSERASGLTRKTKGTGTNSPTATDTGNVTATAPAGAASGSAKT